MTTQYNVDKYIQGVNGFGTLPCDTIYNVTLAATTEETVTVPSIGAMGAIGASILPDSAGRPGATNRNKFVAVFSYSSSASVFVAFNATAAVPAGGTLAAATSILNPTAKLVRAGDVIHMISRGTPDVAIEFFAIQE